MRIGLRALAAMGLAALALAGCDAPPPNVRPDIDQVSAVIDISDQEITVRHYSAATKTTESFAAPVSTGAAGYETPTGTFHPFFLSRNHRSSLYDDAPMPFAVFFNGNIAVHGTTEIRRLGRPASHGCVRVHPEVARMFFELVQKVGKANTMVTVQD